MLVHYEVSESVQRQEILAGIDPRPTRRTVEVDPATLTEDERHLFNAVVTKGYVDHNVVWKVETPRDKYPILNADGITGILDYARRTVAAAAAEQAKHLEAIAQLTPEQFAAATTWGSHITVGGVRLTPEDGAVYEQAAACVEQRLAAQKAQEQQEKAEYDRRRQEQEHRAEERRWAKKSRFALWVAEFGDANQKQRYAEGFLPEQELLDVVRDAIFVPLQDYDRYVRLITSDVEHTEDCSAYSPDDNITYKSAAADTLTRTQYDVLQKLQHVWDAGTPGATITPLEVRFTPREHTAVCDCCEAAATRIGIMVTVTIDGFEFRREFAAE